MGTSRASVDVGPSVSTSAAGAGCSGRTPLCQSRKVAERSSCGGAVAPYERLLQFAIEAPVRAEESWTVRCEMSEKLRDSGTALSREQLTAVKLGGVRSSS